MSETTVPVGLEQILYLAAMDTDFREALLRDREAALVARGLTLRSSELTMLRLAPREQLEATIAGLDTSTESLERRGFLRAVAATVAGAAVGVALGGCEEPDVSMGIRADYREYDYTPIRGIEPDARRDAPRLDAAPDAKRVDAAPDAKRDVKILVEGPMPAGIRPEDGGGQ